MRLRSGLAGELDEGNDGGKNVFALVFEMMLGQNAVRAGQGEKRRSSLGPAQSPSVDASEVEKPKAPAPKDFSRRKRICPISSGVAFRAVSPMTPRRRVPCPTSVAKFTPMGRRDNSEKNSSRLRQLTLLRLASVQRKVPAISPAFTNGAKEEPQFPPRMVVTPWRKKLSCEGWSNKVQWVSECEVRSMKPGET